MTLHLLDSNVVIDYLNGIERATRFVQSLRLGDHGLALTSIVVAEVFAGAAVADRSGVRSILSGFDRLPTDERAAELAGTLRYDFMRRGRALALTDLLVAATALEHGATLVTRNVRDYPIADLNVLSPY